MMAAKQTIALIGAKGMLASMIVKRLPEEYRILPFDLPEFDLTNPGQVARTMARERPAIILNCAAMTDVDGCETRQDPAMRINGDGPGLLAKAAQEIGAVLAHISTDFVFDGAKDSPYVEEDDTGPLSVYGASKLLGEQRIRESGLKRYFIVRTSWLYGPNGKNFVETIARLAGEREELRIVADQRGTPTYTGDLAEALFALLKTDAYGLYHFSNGGECSWHQFATEIIEQLKLRGKNIVAKTLVPVATHEFPLPAKRPAYSVLSKTKIIAQTGRTIPDWRKSLQIHISQRN